MRTHTLLRFLLCSSLLLPVTGFAATNTVTMSQVAAAAMTAVPSSTINAASGVAGLNSSGQVTAPIAGDLTHATVTPTGGSQVNIAEALASYATQTDLAATTAWVNSNALMKSGGTITGNLYTNGNLVAYNPTSGQWNEINIGNTGSTNSGYLFFNSSGNTSSSDGYIKVSGGSTTAGNTGDMVVTTGTITLNAPTTTVTGNLAVYGVTKVPTPAAGDNSTNVATTAWVQSNAVMTNNGESTGQTINSAKSISASGSITTGSYFSSIYHIVPDTLKQTADGADDAASINRAAAQCRTLAIRCEIDLLPRIYYLNSAVDLSEAQVILKGMGVQERTPQTAGTSTVTPWAGTWLQVSTTGFVPVTLGGYGGGGSVVEDLGIYEVHPTPPTSGSWAPTSYGPFFSSQQSLMSIRYHNIFMLGISAGINSDGDQRLEIDHIKGQVFYYVVALHHIYDAPTITDIHQWPYWSNATPVQSYQQNNTDVVALGRVDGAFIDNIFCYACRSAYHLFNDGTGPGDIPGGPPTKIVTGKTYCDFTLHCLYADSTAANIDFSALSMSSQGQDITSSSPLTGANAILLDGYGNVNIHELYTQFADRDVIVMTNSSTGSYVNIGSMRVDTTPMAATSYLFGGVQPSSGVDEVALGTRPAILGTRPSSLTVFQAASSMQVVWPDVSTVASGTAP